MTQRELTANELREISTENELLALLYEDVALRIEKGEKIIAKRKETAKGIEVSIYIYDKKLYRYMKEYSTFPYGI